jgi:hypothetical protein
VTGGLTPTMMIFSEIDADSDVAARQFGNICVPNFRPIRYVSGTVIRLKSGCTSERRTRLDDSEMAAGAFWLVSAPHLARSENNESVDSLAALERHNSSACC